MQHGAIKKLNFKKQEIITTEMIIIRINLDFLRKNLNSFSESGFSGVSNGQMQKMIIAETNVTTNKIF